MTSLIKHRFVKLIKLGTTTYSYAHQVMKFRESLHTLEQNVLIPGATTFNTLLVTTHFPVYTIGTRKHEYDIKQMESTLRSVGADFVVTDRGGLITFHGPGQLIIYPILNLSELEISPRRFVNLLEQCMIDTCKHFNVECQRSADVGVWVGNNKIGALGIHVNNKKITSHGIALNCNTDLSWFNHIVPCGLKNKGVTSISNELKKNITVDEVCAILLTQFEKIFHISLET